MQKPATSFAGQKHNVLTELRLYEELAQKPESQLDIEIRKRLGHLVDHSRSNPWWAKRLDKYVGSENAQFSLSSIPVMRREDIQLHFDAMQVPIAGARETDFVISSTTGSTGKPVSVRKYIPTFGRHNMAVQLLPFKWHNIDQSLRILQLRWNGRSFRTERTGPPFNFLGETSRYRAIRISDTNFEEITEIVEKDEIGILLCSPMALAELVNVAKNREPGLANLKAILTFSERLTSDLRNQVGQITSAKVIDRYSSEEVGLIAIDCPWGNHLHQISTHNYVEIVDEDNQPCDIGQPGRVLVTGLNSYGMPLIRYELGDFASFGQKCVGGISYPVIVPEIYRIKETLRDTEGNLFTVSAAGANSLKASSVDDFQVYLFENTIVVVYAAAAALGEEECIAITKELQERFRSSKEVILRRIAHSSNFSSWKRRDFIKSEENYSPEMTEENLLSIV